MTTKLIHSFMPGDSWLYFQIYGGQSTLDRVLKTKLYDMVDYLHNENLIIKWFFVRYSDPDYHLRVRFYLIDRINTGDLIIYLKDALKDFFEEDLIWKVTINTYQRELQRYLQEGIIFSEEIFYANSELVREFLRDERAIDDTERILFCLWHINTILNFYTSNLDVKIDIIEDYYKYYSEEFRSDFFLKKQLNFKYKKYLDSIKLLFTKDSKMELQDHFIKLEIPFIESYKSNIQFIINVANSNEAKIIDVIKSHIHMFVNRLFITQHRKYELVLYYFLLRYYNLEKGKSKRN